MKLVTTHQPTPNTDTIIIPMVGANPALLEQVATAIAWPAGRMQADFFGEPGEIMPVYAQGKRYFLLGLGEKPEFSEVVKAFRVLSYKWRRQLSAHLTVDWRYLPHASDAPTWTDAALSGLYLGAYRIAAYKTEEQPVHPLQNADAEVHFVATLAQLPQVEAAATRAWAIVETQWRIMDLVNAPANYKLPAHLAEWALNSAATYHYQVEAWGQEEIKTAGLHALLAVNQAGDQPARFIVAQYRPSHPQNTLPTIALVGKGVTFDTGGVSIKPSANLHYMKSDMGGAGAVLGAMEVAAKLQLPVHLVGIVPATENLVGSRAIKPSDVIGSYSGKTIEIIDTDAEGRLILADGLSYAVRQFKPEVVIDLATLTGSAVRALGYVAAAMFTHNDTLANVLYTTGQQCSERVWRLPLWDLYADDVKSEVADLRNFSGKPTAGAISAAKFLEAFVDNHPAWAHLDIAGVAYADSEVNGGKTATAYGVRLLVHFVLDWLAQRQA